MPSGTPTTMARAKPPSTRRSVAAMLSSSARSLHRVGKLRSTSPGLGRTTGEMSRDSGAAPDVNAHQSSKQRPMAPIPTARPTAGDGAARKVKSDGRWGVLVSGFKRIHLHFHAPVLGVVRGID